jgi:hypothetical protein
MRGVPAPPFHVRTGCPRLFSFMREGLSSPPPAYLTAPSFMQRGCGLEARVPSPPYLSCADLLFLPYLSCAACCPLLPFAFMREGCGLSSPPPAYLTAPSFMQRGCGLEARVPSPSYLSCAACCPLSLITFMREGCGLMSTASTLKKVKVPLRVSV